MVPGSEQKNSNVILTPDHRLRVFISSTLKELAEEREAVRQAILKLRLLPVMFEAGARPHPARELYQAYLSQSHIFIGIYWESYGWVAPGMKISGLEDEFNRSARLPRLIYIKSPAPNQDAGLQRMLARLRQENTASYKYFSSIAELGELVENDLALLLAEIYVSASNTTTGEFVPRPLTNIPFPRNPLLGRTRELETLCNWLSRDDIGLVTLTGAGGTGKSRLALEVALELRSQFADGVFLVRLTPVTDPDRVIPAIAETLGLYENAQGKPVKEILTNFLRGRRTLLLLDNFEQVLGAAAQVAELEEACPRLKILVTSRAPLRVRGEREFLVQPLPVPDLRQASDSERLSQYASVALFIQRAQSVRPSFTVTNDNAPAVAEICYRLDGLPLAIELAAARIKLLTPQELLRRLSHRFDILRGGTRDLPERQQTLRGAIDWSYNLLTDPARALFRRLSVFSGGCSIEAAEAVCNLDGDLEPSVLDQMEALVDSSLLNPLDGLEGQQRFGMLESLREYALERLVASGEADRVHRLHAECFLHLAQDMEPRVRTADRARWRAVLEQDLENVRGALDWSSSSPDDVGIGQALMITLTYFWATVSGYMNEGRRLCERFVALINEKTPLPVRVQLLILSKGIFLMQGGTETPTSDWMEVIQMARESGDKPTLGTALLLGGAWALANNDLVGAARYFGDCQPLFHELDDEWSEALAILWLSNTLAFAGQAGRSRELLDRSVALARHQGDPWLLVDPLINIAEEAFSNGDLEKAESTLLEAESVLRTVDDPWHLSWPLTGLAHIQLLRGALAPARAYIAEALQLGREYGNMVSQIFSLLETARLITLLYGHEGADPALRQSKFGNAALLCAATQPFANHSTFIGTPGTRDSYEALMGEVRSTIGTEIWERDFQAGASMPLEQALDLAANELHQAVN